MAAPDRTQPDPSRPGHPWAVVNVLRDAEGAGFAYTNGLWRLYGHAEFWMPDTSNEPMPLQLCGLEVGPTLNSLAEVVRDGRPLEPGELVRAMDKSGMFAFDITIGDPVGKYAVDALLVDRGAAVLPLSWTVLWRDGPPEHLRTPAGGLSCPCEPVVCPDCAAENRAARRARRRRR
ncbi:MAG: DUF4262 domain-containing protein [Mycobacteriales bacterium]